MLPTRKRPLSLLGPTRKFDFYDAGKQRARWTGGTSRRMRAEWEGFRHRLGLSRQSVAVALFLCFCFTFIVMFFAVRFMETKGVSPEKQHEFEFLDDPNARISANDLEDIVERSRFSRSSIPTSYVKTKVERNFGITLHDGQRVHSVPSSGGGNWNNIWNVIQHIDVTETNGITRDSQSELSVKSDRIKSSFLHAWTGYEGVLGHDGIHPVSGTPDDRWGFLGATLVDALDTMLFMDLKDQYQAALDALKSIDFTMDRDESFFEITIRCLGGLLSAYQLSADDILLQKARVLGDRLFRAFGTENGIPKSIVNLKSGDIHNYEWNGHRSILAEIGTNQMEFYSLSELTGDPKYYKASHRVFEMLHDGSRQSPGIFPRSINPNFSPGSIHGNGQYSWGGMSDSFYGTHRHFL